MTDALDRVLRLVAEGRLTAAQAAPILDALSEADAAVAAGRGAAEAAASDDAPRSGTGGTAIRIEVTEGGRKVVNLRIPVSLGRMALERIPGLSMSSAELVRRALEEGRTGTLLSIEDEDDGVRIALE